MIYFFIEKDWLPHRTNSTSLPGWYGRMKYETESTWYEGPTDESFYENGLMNLIERGRDFCQGQPLDIILVDRASGKDEQRLPLTDELLTYYLLREQ